MRRRETRTEEAARHADQGSDSPCNGRRLEPGRGHRTQTGGERRQFAILDLQAERGQAVAAEFGGHFAECDVADEASTEAALTACESALGAPRILINCAGIGPTQKTTSRGRSHDLALFGKVIRVNLIGTFNVTRLVATTMVALELMENGELGMTLPIARDLADQGVRVVTIAPGIFETPLLATLPDPV